jgi:hypothetical protein
MQAQNAQNPKICAIYHLEIQINKHYYVVGGAMEVVCLSR